MSSVYIHGVVIDKNSDTILLEHTGNGYKFPCIGPINNSSFDKLLYDYFIEVFGEKPRNKQARMLAYPINESINIFILYYDKLMNGNIFEIKGSTYYNIPISYIDSKAQHLIRNNIKSRLEPATAIYFNHLKD